MDYYRTNDAVPRNSYIIPVFQLQVPSFERHAHITMTLLQLPPQVPDKIGLLCAEMRWGTGCDRCSSRIHCGEMYHDRPVRVSEPTSLHTYCTSEDEVGVSCPTRSDFADAHVCTALLNIVLLVIMDGTSMA